MGLLPLRNIWIRRNFGAGVFLLTILCGSLATSFIPVKYRATSIIELKRISHEFNNVNDIISDAQLLQNTRSEEIAIIRSHEILRTISSKLKLHERGEFNIESDKNRALITKFTDKIKLYLSDRNNIEDSLEIKIINKLNYNLNIDITNDFHIHISYISKSPHIAKAVANISSFEYSKISSKNYSKEVIKKAELPNKIFIPNIKYAIYLISLIGLITGVIASIYIVPKRKI